uniref:Fork-head domain-containing protein n=1 Tax=Panagrellus redivivus TaxID=6233 RepID=A0A7E4VUJ7_PANRE
MEASMPWITGLTPQNFVKPPYSYIGLIAQAILENPEQRLLLSEIYEAIQRRYPFFLAKGSGWRNSVRHNLSLNDCFVKAGRAPNGKSSYWTIHPANIEDFARGDFRRKQAQWKVKSHDVRAFANQLWGWQSVAVRDEIQKGVQNVETAKIGKRSYTDFAMPPKQSPHRYPTRNRMRPQQPTSNAEIQNEKGPVTRSKTVRFSLLNRSTSEETPIPDPPSTSASTTTTTGRQRSRSTPSEQPLRRSARMAARPQDEVWLQRYGTKPIRCVLTTDGFGRNRVVQNISEQDADPEQLIGDEWIGWVIFDGEDVRVVPGP